MTRITQIFHYFVAVSIVVGVLGWATPSYAQVPVMTSGNEAQLRAVLIALIQDLLAERNLSVVATQNVQRDDSRTRVPLEDITIVAVYEPTGSTLSATSETRSTKAVHNAYWDRIVALVPDDYETRIGEFVVYSDTDEDTDAFVQNLYQDGNDVWRLAINSGTVASPAIEAAAFDELIVHEFAHILTLNDQQIDGGVRERNCNNYYIDEGCPEDDSFFQLFIDDFWSSSQLRTSEALADSGTQSDDVYEFYLRYEDEFVTDYAATNPAEDFAESFASFVVYDEPEGTDIWQQKITFMSDFPELVRIQQSIRAVLDQ